MLNNSCPIFAVRDVVETIAFYRDKLGFTSEWFWGNPVGFGGIHLGAVHVMFHRQPHIAQHVEGHEHHFWSDKLEELHAQHIAAGVPIIEPIANKPWGLREYRVRDNNGYHLRFSGPTTYEKPATALETLPDFIRIECRIPTIEEHASLYEAVGWGKVRDASQLLEQTFGGAVAIDTRDGKAVGALRIMRDSNMWYSIWDVIVNPQFQSQRVGTAIMETALAWIRQHAPNGGSVHLFTMRDPFYEKLGFKHQTAMSFKL